MGLLSKKNIGNLNYNKATFNKKSLEYGTIVMFSDNTFGVYVKGKIGEYMKTELGFINDNIEDEWFISHSISGKSTCFLNLSSLDKDLRYYDGSGDFDVIRIYDRRLKYDEIERFTKKDFFYQISTIVSKMKYTER